VSTYERNPQARQECLKRYGTDCYVCGFNFGRVYGSIGEGFIHVHHLTPFAGSAGRRTNPSEDLRPVCPNCHSMLHREDPPMPIARLKKLFAADSSTTARRKVRR
jgi:predicted HNH restriction endonuclease